MRRCLPLFLLCVLVAGPDGCLGRAAGLRAQLSEPAAPDAGSGALPFDLYEGYVIVARGSAGPLKGLNFFVDTGTSPSILDAKIAHRLHLRGQTPARVVSLSGNAQSEMAILPSLALGPIEISNLPVMLGDLSPFRKALGIRIDAIVGMDVLGQSAFEIDYSTRIIRFGHAPALSASIPVQLDHGLITFEAGIENAPARLVLDTGTSAVVLFHETAPPAEFKRDVPAAHRLDSLGILARQPERLWNVQLGDEEFRGMPVIQLPASPQPQLGFDGLLSPTALGISRVSLDVPGSILSFDREPR